MTLFSSLFGSNEKLQSTQVKWIALTQINQIDEILTRSSQQPVLIFKHSTTCGISRMALKQFEKDFDLEEKVTSYYLDLQAYRSISNEVAKRFDVMHQSPQLLLIEDGRSVYDVSHHAIDVADLRMQIDALGI